MGEADLSKNCYRFILFWDKSDGPGTERGVPSYEPAPVDLLMIGLCSGTTTVGYVRIDWATGPESK